jgi:hypothetical protein
LNALDRSTSSLLIEFCTADSPVINPTTTIVPTTTSSAEMTAPDWHLKNDLRRSHMDAPFIRISAKKTSDARAGHSSPVSHRMQSTIRSPSRPKGGFSGRRSLSP